MTIQQSIVYFDAFRHESCRPTHATSGCVLAMEIGFAWLRQRLCVTGEFFIRGLYMRRVNYSRPRICPIRGYGGM